MSDKRSQTSAANGKKGGRPKKHSTVLAEKARDFIAQELEKNLKPIVKKAVDDAKQGDKAARDWLSERGWGKVPQAVLTKDEDGNDVPLTVHIIGKDE